MIQNNFGPEVAERPEDLVIYGGIGKAARNRECFEQILASLRMLMADETLLVQSGKPVGIFRTHTNAPIVIGRCGSVASPNRETEAMKDGSDAVSDRPLLNALLNTAGGATWVNLYHGGVGMGFSQPAGVVNVADGTALADMRPGP